MTVKRDPADRAQWGGIKRWHLVVGACALVWIIVTIFHHTMRHTPPTTEAVQSTAPSFVPDVDTYLWGLRNLGFTVYNRDEAISTGWWICSQLKRTSDNGPAVAVALMQKVRNVTYDGAESWVLAAGSYLCNSQHVLFPKDAPHP